MKLRSDYVHTYVWRHNALRGGVRFAKQIIRGVVGARTATAHTVALANQILVMLDDLEELLKERFDDESAFVNETQKGEI
jgi:uncharacterized protein (DUF697 family)